jgi:hypothetical protein
LKIIDLLLDTETLSKYPLGELKLGHFIQLIFQLSNLLLHCFNFKLFASGKVPMDKFIQTCHLTLLLLFATLIKFPPASRASLLADLEERGNVGRAGERIAPSGRIVIEQLGLRSAALRQLRHMLGHFRLLLYPVIVVCQELEGHLKQYEDCNQELEIFHD